MIISALAIANSTTPIYKVNFLNKSVIIDFKYLSTPTNAKNPAEKYTTKVTAMKIRECHFFLAIGNIIIIVAIVAGFKESNNASMIIEK